MPIAGVTFVSKQVAESMPAAPDVGIISITSPNRPDAFLQEGWGAVLRLEYHDIDSDSVSALRAGYIPMSREQAQQVLDWLDENNDKLSGVVVHCEAGISRSAATAHFITDYYDLGILSDPGIPNRHVYKLLYEAWKGPVSAPGHSAFEGRDDEPGEEVLVELGVFAGTRKVPEK